MAVTATAKRQQQQLRNTQLQHGSHNHIRAAAAAAKAAAAAAASWQKGASPWCHPTCMSDEDDALGQHPQIRGDGAAGLGGDMKGENHESCEDHVHM